MREKMGENRKKKRLKKKTEEKKSTETTGLSQGSLFFYINSTFHLLLTYYMNSHN